MGSKTKKMFSSWDGTKLDIILEMPANITPQACIIIYPCIGGTTRSYMVPADKLAEMGFAVVQYHPRSHGRSEGQMSMYSAIRDLYYYLSVMNFSELPIIAVGHSAGCNALLQLSTKALKIVKYLLVQPVFDFRESIIYMYKNGDFEEFISAIERWTFDKSSLISMLEDGKWINMKYWHENKLCHKIDKISKNLYLGSFLEDFYIPGYNTYPYISYFSDKSTIYLSKYDKWFPTNSTEKISNDLNIPMFIMESSGNHFMTGCWDSIWENITKSLS